MNDSQSNSSSQTHNSTYQDQSSPPPPPPTYAEARLQTIRSTQHPFELSHRLPEGLFIIRSRSSSKVWDIRGGSVEVGSEVIGYDFKQPTLQDGELMHRKNNQLFFLDWHGCLCAANSCLRVDVHDFNLQLSSPRPVSSKSSPSSHPPPQFHYDPLTRTISVHFSHDPTYSGTTLEQIESVDYLLELQPKSRFDQPTPSTSALEKLSEWLPFNRSPTSPITSLPSVSSSTSSTLPTSQIPLSFPSSTPDSDLDDSPDPCRTIRVVSVAPGWREKFPSSGTPEARKWLKRQWDIATIVCQTRQDHDLRTPLDLSGIDPDPSNLNQSVLAELGGVLGELGTELSRAFGGRSSQLGPLESNNPNRQER